VLEVSRVIDLCDELGWPPGKILGDLGPEVIEGEPPGGDRVDRRVPHPNGLDPEHRLVWAERRRRRL
jgi:crotonobetainyl-CoA:carnitine CoA-transferase CaiB-like acyl-CoA transferase